MNDNLPPLPKPEALQRKQLSHGGYEMRPVFTPEQMHEYGQLCRQQALEDAAKVCDDFAGRPDGNYSETCAVFIRSLK